MDDTLDGSNSRTTTIDAVKALLHATREEISGRILHECWGSDDRELVLRLWLLELLLEGCRAYQTRCERSVVDVTRRLANGFLLC